MTGLLTHRDFSQICWEEITEEIFFFHIPTRADFCETFSWQVYKSQFLPEICWKEVTEEILSYFRFYARPRIRTRALRLISQHTTYKATATSFAVHFIHFGRVVLEVVRSEMYKVYTERTALYSFNFITLLVTSIIQAEVWIRRTHGMFPPSPRK